MKRRFLFINFQIWWGKHTTIATYNKHTTIATYNNQLNRGFKGDYPPYYIDMTEPLLLRNNKGNYKVIRTVPKMSPYLATVWKEWENEHSEFTANIIYPILKKFLSGETIRHGRIDASSEDTPYYAIQINESTLVLIGLNSDDQKYLLLACKQMGLQCIPPDPRFKRETCCCCF